MEFAEIAAKIISATLWMPKEPLKGDTDRGLGRLPQEGHLSRREVHATRRAGAASSRPPPRSSSSTARPLKKGLVEHAEEAQDDHRRHPRRQRLRGPGELAFVPHYEPPKRHGSVEGVSVHLHRLQVAAQPRGTFGQPALVPGVQEGRSGRRLLGRRAEDEPGRRREAGAQDRRHRPHHLAGRLDRHQGQAVGGRRAPAPSPSATARATGPTAASPPRTTRRHAARRQQQRDPGRRLRPALAAPPPATAASPASESRKPDRNRAEGEARWQDSEWSSTCSAASVAEPARSPARPRTTRATRADGQSFNWADFVMKTEGKFPNVTHTVMPVLCNHCSDAACVTACPVTPKAMYKTPEGITMHDDELCIGCRSCQNGLPVQPDASWATTASTGEGYSVISFNGRDSDPQPYWADASSAIPGCTASGAETAKAAGATAPAMNQCGRRRCRSGPQGRRRREMHLLLSPHQQRPRTRLRRGLSRQGAHLRRPGRSRTPKSPRSSRRRSPSACRRTRAPSRTCTMSASTRPAPDVRPGGPSGELTS